METLRKAQTSTRARRHLVGSRAPVGGIPLMAAFRKYHVSIAKIWKLVEAGQVAAGMGRGPGRTGRRCVLVSGPHLSRVIRTMASRVRGQDGPPPADGVPVAQAARDVGVTYGTLRKWCQWDPHPGLGRRLRSGIGSFAIRQPDGVARTWRGPLVSRADVGACVDLARRPFNRPIPDTPGQWIAEGIFQHASKGLFFTERYVRAHRTKFGLPARTLFSPRYLREVERLLVVWPTATAGRGRWQLSVFSEVGLNRLRDVRAGKADGGEWLIDGEIWKDADGLWFSTSPIARQLGLDHSQFKKRYRDTGLIGRIKMVAGRAKSGAFKGQRSGTVCVHHESEVRPLLGMAGQPGPARSKPPAHSKRPPGRPPDPEVRRVYAFCYEHWVAGKKKLAVIRAEAERLFGARAPKDAKDVSAYARRHAQREGLPLRQR